MMSHIRSYEIVLRSLCEHFKKKYPEMQVDFQSDAIESVAMITFGPMAEIKIWIGMLWSNNPKIHVTAKTETKRIPYNIADPDFIDKLEILVTELMEA